MSNILTGPVDLAAAPVPTTVRVDDKDYTVLAAAYLQAALATASAHIVVYCYTPDAQPGDEVQPDERLFAVGLWVHKSHGSYLSAGNYDLTYAEALEDFSQRVARGH